MTDRQMTMMETLREQVEARVYAIEISEDAAIALATEVAGTTDPRCIMDAFGRIIAGEVKIDDVPVMIGGEAWARRPRQ